MFFKDENPDFRKMSPSDIQTKILSLSREIKLVKELKSPELGFYLEGLESERGKYKQVWRARPGRKSFNIAARKEREKLRRKKNFKAKFPFIP